MNENDRTVWATATAKMNKKYKWKKKREEWQKVQMISEIPFCSIFIFLYWNYYSRHVTNYMSYNYVRNSFHRKRSSESQVQSNIICFSWEIITFFWFAFPHTENRQFLLFTFIFETLYIDVNANMFPFFFFIVLAIATVLAAVVMVAGGAFDCIYQHNHKIWHKLFLFMIMMITTICNIDYLQYNINYVHSIHFGKNLKWHNFDNIIHNANTNTIQHNFEKTGKSAKCGGKHTPANRESQHH